MEGKLLSLKQGINSFCDRVAFAATALHNCFSPRHQYSDHAWTVQQLVVSLGRLIARFHLCTAQQTPTGIGSITATAERVPIAAIHLCAHRFKVIPS